MNGQYLELINLSRGVWQGCPFTPLLLNVNLERLAIAINDSLKIEEVSMQSKEFKVAQYADDAVFFEQVLWFL